AVRHFGKALPPAVLIAVLRCGALAAQDFDAIGQHRTRIDADDTHAGCGAPAADGAGERHQAGIAHGAGDIGGVEPFAAEPDNVDDDAALTLAHHAQIKPRQADIAENFEIPAGAPGRLVDVVERAARNGAGIVDQDVDVGKRLEHAL